VSVPAVLLRGRVFSCGLGAEQDQPPARCHWDEARRPGLWKLHGGILFASKLLISSSLFSSVLKEPATRGFVRLAHLAEATLSSASLVPTAQ
jgi:hypothetical protein